MIGVITVCLLVTLSFRSVSSNQERQWFHRESDTNRHHYLYINTRATWQAAQTMCQDWDGDLVQINDENEYQFLVSQSIRAGIRNFWLGLKRACDNVTCTEWQWSNGESVNLTRWDQESLDNAANTYLFAHINITNSSNDGQSWVANGNTHYRYVMCEIMDNCVLPTQCPDFKKCVRNGPCECFEGFWGDQCEIDLEYNACASNPCINGSCTQGVNSYYCECHHGYEGEQCQHEIDECQSNPCVHGDCTNDINSYTCTCEVGYNGNNCETEIDECQSDPCDNGDCLDNVNEYVCSCYGGWTGTNCETDIDECMSHPCVHGRCTNGQNMYSCDCSMGFTGVNCDSEINECISSPCGSNGRCIDQLDRYSCECDDGFNGTYCQDDINECLTEDCGQGTCENSIGSFKCNCKDGFTGVRCQHKAEDEQNKALKTGLITGFVVAFVAIAVFVVILIIKRKRNSKKQTEENESSNWEIIQRLRGLIRKPACCRKKAKTTQNHADAPPSPEDGSTGGPVYANSVMIDLMQPNQKKSKRPNGSEAEKTDADSQAITGNQSPGSPESTTSFLYENINPNSTKPLTPPKPADCVVNSEPEYQNAKREPDINRNAVPGAGAAENSKAETKPPQLYTGLIQQNHELSEKRDGENLSKGQYTSLKQDAHAAASSAKSPHRDDLYEINGDVASMAEPKKPDKPIKPVVPLKKAPKSYEHTKSPKPFKYF